VRLHGSLGFLSVEPHVITPGRHRWDCVVRAAALRGPFGEIVDAEKPTARPDLMVPFDELNRLMGLDELEAMGARYA